MEAILRRLRTKGGGGGGGTLHQFIRPSLSLFRLTRPDSFPRSSGRLAVIALAKLQCSLSEIQFELVSFFFHNQKKSNFFPPVLITSFLFSPDLSVGAVFGGK